MLKKLPIIFVAIAIFVASFFLLQPAPAKGVVVAAGDFAAGHVLIESDIVLRDLPEDTLPADVITDPALALGQTLSVQRGAGDIIRTSQLGNPITLQPNERAISVSVVDATGVSGMLHPGSLVGVVAMVSSQDSMQSSGWFAKASIENLRVLYVDPRWEGGETPAEPTPDPDSGSFGGVGMASERANQGSVVLAVPVDMQTIFYDKSNPDGTSESRVVNALELLAALTTTDGAKLSIYLMPSEGANTFTSPGLWVPNLIPAFGTPTPTPEVPYGGGQ